jgi:hypothetical protein
MGEKMTTLKSPLDACVYCGKKYEDTLESIQHYCDMTELAKAPIHKIPEECEIWREQVLLAQKKAFIEESTKLKSESSKAPKDALSYKGESDGKLSLTLEDQKTGEAIVFECDYSCESCAKLKEALTAAQAFNKTLLDLNKSMCDENERAIDELKEAQAEIERLTALKDNWNKLYDLVKDRSIEIEAENKKLREALKECETKAIDGAYSDIENIVEKALEIK